MDFEAAYKTADELGLRGYREKHFDVCKKIWQTMVPPSGQADSVQGELLRESEKLRCEACDNGNFNWDGNFAWFCDNIYSILSDSDVLNDEICGKLKRVLDFFKENGEYSLKYNNGEISDEDCNPLKLAYVEDDLYDFVNDCIAEFYLSNPEPIPYEKKDFIHR
ncbi:MAG: hypothetical protein IJZ72_04340 [Oscillospiraceae bacterium]|nr:hypothetical protein [Oscillospiraceae bacterium]